MHVVVPTEQGVQPSDKPAALMFGGCAPAQTSSTGSRLACVVFARTEMHFIPAISISKQIVHYRLSGPPVFK